MGPEDDVEFLDSRTAPSTTTTTSLRRSSFRLWMWLPLAGALGLLSWLVVQAGSGPGSEPAATAPALPTTEPIVEIIIGEKPAEPSSGARGITTLNPDGSWIRVEYPDFDETVTEGFSYQLLFGGGESLDIIDVLGKKRVHLGRPELVNLVPLFTTQDYLVGLYDSGEQPGSVAAVPLDELTSVAPVLLEGVLFVGPDPESDEPNTLLVIEYEPEESGSQAPNQFTRFQTLGVEELNGWRSASIEELMIRDDPNTDLRVLRESTGRGFPFDLERGSLSPDRKWGIVRDKDDARQLSLMNLNTGQRTEIGVVESGSVESLVWREIDLVKEITRDISVITRDDVFGD